MQKGNHSHVCTCILDMLEKLISGTVYIAENIGRELYLLDCTNCIDSQRRQSYLVNQ